LSQGDAKAYAVTAADIAVDDDGGKRRFVEAGVVFQLGAHGLMDFDVRCAQLIQRIDQARFGVFAYLRCQVAWIKQYKLGAGRAGRTHLTDKMAQVAASSKLQRASCCAGLFLKLLLQFLRKGAAGRVRAMDDQDAHSMLLWALLGAEETCWVGRA
jgi:hypothetical protein